MDAKRRKFLSDAAIALAGWSTGARVRAQGAAASLRRAQLGDGLSIVSGGASNVVVLTGAEALLLVDSGPAEEAQALRQLLSAEFSGAPVEVLFNTHWHPAHTGGNDVVAEQGTSIVAHENTRLWMSTKFYVDWEDRRYGPRAPAARPNETFFSSDPQPLELVFDGEPVVYGHLREAHTDGDVYVRFPQRNVIVAGGVVTAGTYPVLDYITGGWMGGLEDATRQLIEMTDSETLVVPELGPPQRRADLELQLELVATVRERIEAMALEGLGIDDMIAAGLTKEFDDRFTGDASLFIANAYHGMWQGRLRGTVA